MRRVRPITIATVTALALTGATAQAAGLTQERYTALDTAYKLAAKADKIKSPTKSGAALAQACAKLDGSSDALLVSQKKVCSTLAAFQAHAAVPGCDDSAQPARSAAGRESCASAIRTARGDVRKLIVAAQADRKVVAREVSDAKCRAAIQTPSKDIAFLKQAEKGFALLERAVRTGSKRDLKRAERLIGTTGDSRSSTAALKEFERSCKPG